MQEKPHLVLASASPRRRELLKLLQTEFEVLPSQTTETAKLNESPQDMVQRLAQAKAEHVKKLRPNATIIGADTVVVNGNQILGKPNSLEEARKMLRQLSGRTHHVLTGVCVIHEGACKVNVSQTAVHFSSLSNREIESYLKTGEPLDKAGAYAIQGLGSRFVEKIDGCFFNVVGLPIPLLYQMLKQIGFQFDG